MHLKVFVKLKKTLKTLSSGQKNPKKPKKKNPKKNNGPGFFFKPGFFQPCCTVFTMKISAIGEGGE
jgi:hypothetical protein